MEQPGRPSFAASDTTYHSFNDIELLEPPQSPPTTTYGRPPLADIKTAIDQSYPVAVKMQRQDSGYESHTASPRTSDSHNRPNPLRRTSISSSNGGGSGPSLRSRGRPSTRRSVTSQSSVNYFRSSHSTYRQQQQQQQLHHQIAYYQFPAPDLVELTETSASQEPVSPSSPPQTTHYWTSDSTRRLEYAAIDAAGRGVKGWIRRNLLPDCFVGKERHVAFDDDTGSVRRYRLDLEEDQDEKFASTCNPASRRKSRFPFWGMRRNPTF